MEDGGAQIEEQTMDTTLIKGGIDRGGVYSICMIEWGLLLELGTALT